MKQTKLERQIWVRITVAVAAYAYEFEGASIISDGAFDALCKEVEPDMDTGKPVLDRFFREEFQPHTGQWIYNHPELDKVRAGYLRRVATSPRPTS